MSSLIETVRSVPGAEEALGTAGIRYGNVVGHGNCWSVDVSLSEGLRIPEVVAKRLVLGHWAAIIMEAVKTGDVAPLLLDLLEPNGGTIYAALALIAAESGKETA